MIRKIESLPANGSIIVLNTSAANGAAGSAGRLTGSPVVGFWHSTGGRSLGAGRYVVTASSSGRDADILGARAAEHRRDFAIDYGSMQRGANFGIVERALVEIFFEQRVVGLGDRFEQRGARRFRLSLQFAG